jgi:hypothetical protein
VAYPPFTENERQYMQVFELAKELGITSKQIQELLEKPAATSKVDADEEVAVREEFPVTESSEAEQSKPAVRESVVFWSENAKHAVPNMAGTGLVRFIDYRCEAYKDGEAYSAIMRERDSEIRIVVDERFTSITDLKTFRGMLVDKIKTGPHGEESLVRGLAFLRALFNPGQDMEDFASTLASDGVDGAIELAVQNKSFKVL